MPITNHVTSLELSRRLKELKVPQTTMFWWTEWGTDEDVCDEESIEFHKRSDYPRVVFCHTQSPKHGVPPKSIITSAYLASELGEMLPYRIGKERFNHFTLRMWNEYSGLSLLSYEKPTFDEVKGQGTIYLHSTNADTEANARAKMLIYLIENHLISVEELGK